MKIVVLEGDSLGKDVSLEYLNNFGDVQVYRSSEASQVGERIRDADVVLVNKIQMDYETLKDAENLKLICITATGTNNVDFAYTNERGIKVTNVKGYSTNSVAQHTFALLFYIMEKLNFYDNFVKSGKYAEGTDFSYFAERFHELSGKTWGVVGLGEIGKKVADIAKAFGCNVVYYSTSGKNSNPSYQQVDWKTLLTESDVISVHAPLNPSTRNLFNREAFSNMKKSAIFINVGRGPIVNEKDLAEALNNDEIAGAGLDVMSQEPPTPDNPLLAISDSRKLIITPHIAWATYEARTRLVDEIFKNIEAWTKGEERNVVTG